MLLNDGFPDDIDGWARLRSDIPRLARILPRRTVGSFGMVLLLTFSFAFVVAAAVMSIVLAGLRVGVVVNLCGIATYLLVRTMLKKWGGWSFGVFTIGADLVVRAMTGIGQVRYRARGKDQMFIGRGKMFAIGVPIALVLCIGPPTLAVVFDLPEVMLGAVLFFLLPLADLALAVTRGAIDATKRRGSTLNSEFALVVAAQFVHDGGDAERLVTGVPLDNLLPRDAEQLRETMYEAALRQKLLTTDE
ncbi:hypothetical protein [Paramicrobacterium chengjingii]|uniref:hypothetical protein n=1 Tax=Paramicrobacterium chengjingii TaxID=2769067 RepID=UPI00141E114F|nr:hypothetical protein [Microbacterium chengjingii]